MISIENIRLFLFDMDGTLYLGEQLFPFTRELLSRIRASGRDYRFMTNNSSKSVTEYVRKMERLGVPATAGDFVTSAQATVRYLLANHKSDLLYVSGTRALLDEFRAAGLRVTDAYGEDVDAAVVAFDTELTFRKLDDLSRLLTRGLPFVATHPDMVCPTEYGYVPDCGAFCEMLYHATGRRPTVIGKPEPLMAEMAMEAAGVKPTETLVVGDRLHTDIATGVNAGTRTLLVLSGEATLETLAASPVKPDAVAESCGEILAALRALEV